MKIQKEALKRYERFLPMLQLKQQLLQVEVQTIITKTRIVYEKENELQDNLKNWIDLLSEPASLKSLIAIQSVTTVKGNIAGVEIPVLESVTMHPALHDLFNTPPWIDDAIQLISRLVELETERKILEEQKTLIAKELRVTTQRVNLFEKVKIPESKENIRIIKIFLGDEQTAMVVRGKIAKKRCSPEKNIAIASPLLAKKGRGISS